MSTSPITKEIPIENILTGYNPRENFEADAMTELKNSIFTHGLLQAITVRKSKKHPTGFEIVAGERRFRAISELAEQFKDDKGEDGKRFKKIAARVVEYTDVEALKAAYVENEHRRGLNPIEAAKTYAKLMELGVTQTDMAHDLSISQSLISNRVRLLKLPEDAQNLILTGDLAENHGVALLPLGSPEQMSELAQEAAETEMPLAQLRKRVAELVQAKEGESAAAFPEKRKAKGLSPERMEVLTGSSGEIGTSASGHHELGFVPILEQNQGPATTGITGWRRAEKVVAAVLQQKGYTVEDRSREKLGYDWIARKDGHEIFIEVKFITRPGEPFIMTLNEEAVARAKGSDYYVALVRELDDFAEIAWIRNPANTLPLDKQCRQWVWECSRYNYEPSRHKLSE